MCERGQSPNERRDEKLHQERQIRFGVSTEFPVGIHSRFPTEVRIGFAGHSPEQLWTTTLKTTRVEIGHHDRVDSCVSPKSRRSLQHASLRTFLHGASAHALYTTLGKRILHRGHPTNTYGHCCCRHDFENQIPSRRVRQRSQKYKMRYSVFVFVQATRKKDWFIIVFRRYRTVGIRHVSPLHYPPKQAVVSRRTSGSTDHCRQQSRRESCCGKWTICPIHMMMRMKHMFEIISNGTAR